MDGYRYSVERQKLCIWLENEKRKVESLPRGERLVRELELEREFRIRVDALYGHARSEFEPPSAN